MKLLHGICFPQRNDKDLRDYLVSMNPSIFSNLFFHNESTLWILLKNRSVDWPGSLPQFDALRKYLTRIGLDESVAEEIEGAAEEVLQSDLGILVQCFSKRGSRTLDEYCYASVAFGVPVAGLNLHQIFSMNTFGSHPKDIDYQLRLLMTQEGTLNPDGDVRMVVWDFLEDEVKHSLREAIRKIIRSAVERHAKEVLAG